MATAAQSPSLEEIHESSIKLAEDAGAIIPFMEDEIQRFDAEVDRFRTGELDNTVFTPFRLRQGVYGPASGRRANDPGQAARRHHLRGYA